MKRLLLAVCFLVLVMAVPYQGFSWDRNVTVKENIRRVNEERDRENQARREEEYRRQMLRQMEELNRILRDQQSKHWRDEEQRRNTEMYRR